MSQFIDVITATQGFIARDDTRNEFVVSFRGSREIASALIGKIFKCKCLSTLTPDATYVDTSLVLSQLRGPGLPKNTGAHVHTGFLFAFISVGDTVLDVLREQLEKYSHYEVAVCGKSRCLLSMSSDNVCCRSFPWGALDHGFRL